MRVTKAVFGVLLGSLLTLSATAGTIDTYIAVDNNVTSTSTFAGSNAASSAFQASAPATTTLNTISFENLPVTAGDHPISLGNGVTLTFTNVNIGGSYPTGITNNASSYIFNTTPGGSNFVEYATQDAAYQSSETALMTFTFDEPVFSFGSYISGLFEENDVSAPFQISYQFNDGAAQSIALHGPDDSTASTVGFYGFTDSSSFTSVSIAGTIENADPDPTHSWLLYVGVDDVTYAVPEPGSFMLFGSGMAALAGCWKRRKR
jgi:hypothetical protein